MSSHRSVRPTPSGLEIDLWVVPGASRTELAGTHDGAVRLRVASPPSGGEANRTIARFLTERTGAKVRILRGQGSRLKVVHVASQDIAAVSAALGLEA